MAAPDSSSSSSSNGPLPDFSDSTAATIARRAQRAIDKFVTKSPPSPLVGETTGQNELLPALFTRDEISTTLRIAKGGFCDIWGIKKLESTTKCKPRPLTKHEQECRFALLAEEKDSSSCVKDDHTNNNPQHATPEQMKDEWHSSLPAKQKRLPTTKYVLKHVSKDHISHLGMFLAAAIDLGREAHILQSIQHPHILKLRGSSFQGVQSYKSRRHHDSYFLILDRLLETLDDRIDAWVAAKSSSEPFFGRSERSERQRQLLLAERLVVCSDIASALEYLHERNIMHRDLKPANLGFDGWGRVQLFDFGIAEQLPPPQNGHHNNYDVMHEDLEGGIRSYRYMAPEIAKHQPYNLKADVFSFAVICYFVLSLQRPHGHIEDDDDMLREQLLQGNGKKLNSSHIKSLCSNALCERLQNGWSWDVKVRPTMGELHKLLKEEHEYVLANKAPLLANKNNTTNGAFWMTILFQFLMMRWHDLQLYLMSWMPKNSVRKKQNRWFGLLLEWTRSWHSPACH